MEETGVYPKETTDLLRGNEILISRERNKMTINDYLERNSISRERNSISRVNAIALRENAKVLRGNAKVFRENGIIFAFPRNNIEGLRI